MGKDHDNHNHIHHNSGTSISSVLIGMAIGAAITYLFANREGQKIRDQILKEGARLLDEVAEKAKELEQKAREKQEDVREEIEQMVEEVPEHIEKIQKKGRRFFFRRSHAHES